ncbi:S8 family peptidase [[Clostridium] colinum]|uniref:S8 family peptidase n=1 Tax=[Clostridium] colinum TaxID=36835 RepID=UPI0020254EBA|nr:S8 family serine peptidase [[Clostridium] colinum]
MSAPFVTGACALLMEWGIVNKNDLFLYGQRLKAFLRLGAKRNQNLIYPNKEWGYGSLCILNTINILEIYNVKGVVSSMNLEESENMSLNDIAYSEEYVSMFAEYNNETRLIIEKYDFIKICKVLTGDFVILYIKKDKFNTITQEEMSKMSLQQPFNLGLMDKSALEATGVLAIQNQPFLNLRGNGVLIGIVDTGINYTLDEFIYEDNTSKIVSIWDQTIPNNTSQNYCFGTEYTREDINLALSKENPFDIVPSKDEIGHGTKLASICAGRENIEKNFIGVAPDAELVVVKLKQSNKNLRDYEFVPDNVPAYSSSDLILGIEYLYEKSLELNKPLAICIGMGSNTGFHNGLSILESYISNIAIKNGICINICNGNEGNAQHHSLIKVDKTGDKKTLEFKIAENERGIMLTIVAYPSDRISINIISPTGESTGKIPPRDNYNEEILLPLSNTRIRIQYYNKSFASSGQLTLIKFITPSEGIWKIDIYGEKILIGDIHSWLPIKNFLKEDTFFLTPDPFYTVTLPATANSIVSVGGYNHFDNSFFIQSGRGPTRLNDIRPIVCAPAVNISCINEDGNLDTITGTSGAAAISTGCSALMLEWGIVKKNSLNINTISIISYFISGAQGQKNELLPNNLWGFGKLNILSTFENL